jgi:thiol-disulfide isomerase/thioredoxin
MIRLTRLMLLAALVIAVPCRAMERQIYPGPEQAAADIAAALKTAAAEHRRVILDFGGDWCADCQALDLYFHDEANRPILEANFVLVHINIGHEDQNLDIAARYGIPLDKGVPALAVLNRHGKLLYSQRGGEFEAMRRMESSAVTAFLNRWKPAKATWPVRRLSRSAIAAAACAFRWLRLRDEADCGHRSPAGRG